jgi:pentatricopeptide repeat domain-containing protein 1
VAPNLLCVNSAITACARGGEWQRAFALLASLPARGLKADLYTLNGAIAACAKGGRADDALDLLGRMQVG